MRPRSENFIIQRSRAFTIYELLIALMLIALIGRIAAPFAVRTVMSMCDARAEATANAQFDNAIHILRGDVWKSVAIRLVSPHELVLTQSDHHDIRWQYDSDQHLRQIDSTSPPRNWGILPGSFEFTQDGAAVRVKIADAPHFHGGEYCMACPVMLVAEAKR